MSLSDDDHPPAFPDLDTTHQPDSGSSAGVTVAHSQRALLVIFRKSMALL